MRICIPVESDAGLDSGVHGHFGSAPFYVFADPEHDEIRVIRNGNHQHRHGECRPVEHVSSENIDAVVCAGMGKRALSSLEGAGIEVFVSDRKTVREILAGAKRGELTRLRADQACGGHGRGHECS